jgi:hypothetical protein
MRAYCRSAGIAIVRMYGYEKQEFGLQDQTLAIRGKKDERL